MTSFTKDTEHISTRASIEEKELMIILNCYSAKEEGQIEGKRKQRKFNGFEFPFCFPVAKLRDGI